MLHNGFRGGRQRCYDINNEFSAWSLEGYGTCIHGDIPIYIEDHKGADS